MTSLNRVKRVLTAVAVVLGGLVVSVPSTSHEAKRASAAPTVSLQTLDCSAAAFNCLGAVSTAVDSAGNIFVVSSPTYNWSTPNQIFLTRIENSGTVSSPQYLAANVTRISLPGMPVQLSADNFGNVWWGYRLAPQNAIWRIRSSERLTTHAALTSYVLDSNTNYINHGLTVDPSNGDVYAITVYSGQAKFYVKKISRNADATYSIGSTFVLTGSGSQYQPTGKSGWSGNAAFVDLNHKVWYLLPVHSTFCASTSPNANFMVVDMNAASSALAPCQPANSRMQNFSVIDGAGNVISGNQAEMSVMVKSTADILGSSTNLPTAIPIGFEAANGTVAPNGDVWVVNRACSSQMSIAALTPTGSTYSLYASTSTAANASCSNTGIPFAHAAVDANSNFIIPTQTSVIIATAAHVPKLATPTGLASSATTSTAKSIDVSWSAVTGASSYKIKIYNAAGTAELGTKSGVSGTSTTLTTSTYASMADNTPYMVSVTAVGDAVSYDDSVESSLVSATTNVNAAAPTISSHPISLSRTSGQSATLSVTATTSDGGTLSYIWRKDGVAISGEVASTLAFNPIATSDAGSYTAVVTNTISNGVSTSSTSTAATLTVAGALTVTTPISGLSGTANSSYSLAIAGSGGKTALSYSLNGTLINGLSLSTSTGTISGTPTVAGSSTVSITVTDANGATASTSNFTISIGYASTTVSLSLASASPQYRISNIITATTSRAGVVNFKLDGTSIPGCEAVAAASTTATCAWTPIDLGATSLSAEFTPTLTSAYSSSTASMSTTVVARAITITPTANQSKLFGDSESSITYSITSGSLYGLDTLTGALSRVAGENPGTYAITAGNLYNANYAITLVPVNFTIRGAGTPTISSSPSSLNKTSGQSATFAIVASSPDSGTLSYQWFKDGVAVANALSTSYTINPVSSAHAGSYTVVVTNTISNGVSTSTATTTSSVATLTVAGALTVTTPMSGLSGTANSSYSLTIAGSGGRATLSYVLTGSLLSGLSFNGSTGTISGTPTEAGSSTLSVTVTDTNGATASTSNFTVAIGYASTTVSLALASASPQYRISNTITATTSRAGVVNFKLDGTSIPGCEAVTAASTTATCAWTPIDLGSAALAAEFTPTSSTAYSASSASLSTTVSARAITVTPTAGQSKAFGDAEPVISYTITSGSLYGLDTLTGALSRVAGEDAGSYAITAGNLYNANYAITLVPSSFVITQIAQAPVVLSTFNGVYGTGVTLAASGGSGNGAYSYLVISSGSAGCSITSGVLNATSPGTCTVSAIRAASTNYLVASSGATTMTIVKATQSVVSLTSTSGTYNTNISLTASGGTGTGSYLFSVSDAGTAGCSIAMGPSLTSSSAGSCTVTVSRAGDNNYEPRSSVATLVTFAKDTQNTLTLRDNSGDLDSGITLSVSGGSGTGSVSYSVTSGSAGCSITSGVVNARFAGSCTLTTTKATDVNYLQKQITNTLTFVKATQSSIQVTSTSGSYGTPIQLTSNGGSGSGAVTYAVSDNGSASCAVNGTQLTFTSAGTCKVVATRDGDNVFDARSSASTTITIDRISQTPLSVATSTGDLFTGIIVAVTGGGGSGSVSTSVTSGTANCTLTAGLVTARNIGTCSLSISKAGDTNFFSASATVALTFAKAIPSLGTVSSPTSSALGTGITLAYTGGTGNGAITYTLVSAGTAGCSITNGVLNATSGGKCTVTITKQGDDTYADQVTTAEFTFIDNSAPSTTTTTIARAASTAVTTPKATPTTSTTLVPTTTVAPKKQVLPPSLVNTESAAGAATIGGKTTKAKTTRVNNQLVFTAGGFTVTLAGVNADGTIIPLSSEGLLEVRRGDMFRLDAQGFAPNSTVNIWMFSKTFLMDTIDVGADGLVKSTLKVPKSVEDGLHHLVMVGVDRAKTEAKFEVGMNVGVPPKQWWYSRILIAIPISIAVFIGFWLPTSASRRRRRRTT